MLYLFFGPDDYARTEAIASLKAAYPEDIAAFNITQLEGRSAKLADLRTACDAYPVMHDRRLVIVNDVLKLAKAADMREGLRALAGKLPDSTDLVLNESDAPDSRLAVVKDIQGLAKAKRATLREFALREGAALTSWVIDHARQQGAALRPDAAQLLVDYVGADGWTLHNELAKLAAYVGPDGAITSREIHLLVTDETETNMFAFIDALCARRGPAAIQSLHGLLADGAAPLYILTMIARQVRLMLAAASAGRMSPDELARLLGQKPFVARKAAEQARGYTPAELRGFHDQVLAIDHGIKTGKIDAEGALEVLVGEFGFPTSKMARRVSA
jgi:DNA polymerase III subunit delta